MKFGICNETFAGWTLRDAATFSRACGYTGLELAPFTLAADMRQLSEHECHDIRSTIENAGLEVIGLHWLLAKTTGFHLTSPDREVRLRTSKYLQELARVCRQLGGGCMVFGSPAQRNLLPGISREEGMQYAADVLRATVPALAQYQVVLALEPLGPEEGNFLLTAQDALELRDRVNADEVQLHLDVKAMSTEASAVPTIIRQGAEHLAHFHANDPNRRGPGMGDTDFVPILRTLKDIRYEGWVSVEVFDDSPGPEVLARESIRYLQDCLAQLDDSQL